MSLLPPTLPACQGEAANRWPCLGRKVSPPMSRFTLTVRTRTPENTATAAGSRAGETQSLIGAAVIIGAATAIFGSFCHWWSFPDDRSGFEMGFLTNSQGSGADGWCILGLGVLPLILGRSHYRGRSVLSSLVLLLVGLSLAAIAVFEAVRSVDVVGPEGGRAPGLPLILVGGMLLVIAEWLALIRNHQRN